MSHTLNIPMIDLPRVHQPYQQELDAAILAVVRSGQYISGPVVHNFERQVSSYLDAPVFGVGNGTDALQIALMVLGIGPGDEVIVPAFTYAASAEVIGLLGATVVWCDIESQNYNVSADSLEALVTSKTKAIIAVHLYGQCANIEAIEQAAHGIPIVEDAAQAFGAVFTSGKYKGQKAGTVGTFGTFSFFPTKPLGGLGDAGAICTKNTELFQSANSIAKHGQSSKYVHDTIGVNSRLDPIQAAALTVKLKYFEASINAKYAIANRYKEALTGLSGIQLPITTDYSTHAYHQYTLRVKDNRRAELALYLKNNGISTMVYYPMLLSDQQAYKHWGSDIELAQARMATEEVLSLPIDESLTLIEQQYIINAIHDFFS